jgi:hypothetical protein
VLDYTKALDQKQGFKNSPPGEQGIFIKSSCLRQGASVLIKRAIKTAVYQKTDQGLMSDLM